MLRFITTRAILLFVMVLCVRFDFMLADDIPQTIQPHRASGSLESQYMDLLLEFEENSAFLKTAALFPGTMPLSSINPGGDWYRAEILDAGGQSLYFRSFQNPAVRFYDEIDPETQTISGGYILEDRALYHLRLPLLDTAEILRILSPGENIIYRETFSNLIRVSREYTPSIPLWDTETLLYNGDPDNRIDLVFMGDGYTINDTTTFRNDVIEFTNHMFSVSPYDEYNSYFNVHLVYVISAESGADHPELNPPVYRNTVLGAYYNCANTPRLICVNDDTVHAVAQASFPYYDKIIVLVNDPIYGGSGGSIAVSYNGTWGKWVFNHEFGHSFGYLLDEYLYGNQPGTVSGCNCDTDNSNPKWQAWINIGSPGVGAFPGCSWSNYYRPTYDECTMNTLRDNFGVVCTEQLAKSINVRVLSFENFYPLEDPTIELGQTQNFYITPLAPATHQLLTHWYVDGVPLGGAASDSFSFMPANTGFYSVMAIIFDSTELVLNDPEYMMVDGVEWQVEVTPSTAISDVGGKSLPGSVILYSNYPNPFNPETQIEYYLPSASDVFLQIYDVWGRAIKTIDNGHKTSGTHRTRWDGTDQHGREVASGVYFYVLVADKATRLTRKMMLMK